MSSDSARNNMRMLRGFVLLAAMVVAYSVLFHLLMAATENERAFIRRYG